MARTILAAVAALCALAAVSGVSILGEAPQLQLQLSEQQEEVAADLALTGSSPDDDREALEQALVALQNKIQETVDDAEAALNNTEQAVETEAVQLGNTLRALVQEWVDKANQARVDASDCVNKGVNAIFTDVVKSYVDEATGCVTQPIKDLKQIVKNLRELGLQVVDVQQNLEVQFESCNKKSIIEKLPCKIKVGGTTGVKLTQLTTEAATNVAKAVTLVTGLQTNLAACERKVSQSVVPRTASVVATTISCIAGKLGLASQLN